MFIEPALEAAFQQTAVHKTLAAGATFLQSGDDIRYIPIVLRGTLRVLLQNAQGDEYFLYHIFPEESCAMSLWCCQAHRQSEVKAVAETETEIVLIPIHYVDEWMRYGEWRKFVSDTHAQRFTELLEAIELVAFSQLDEQIWHYLLRRVQATGERTLHITHQEIATELNSPREVVTRLLHRLQQHGRIRLSRNSIELLSVM
jgi:CRP/FNR family transcriptional regulator